MFASISRNGLLFAALIIISAANAFLYHQVPPTSYSNYYKNFSQSTVNAQPEAHQRSSNARPLARRANYNLQQEQYRPETHNHADQSNQQLKTSTSLQTANFAPISYEQYLDESEDVCPSECTCNKDAQIADCANKNLAQVPKNFPRYVKRIKLERNKITELEAYAFKGLSKLQRIDLSNNAVERIDPLAFSGGLSALNSLILYSNKISNIPKDLFKELSQLQLLLLNANSIECVHKDLFQSLSNLNLLSLYNNDIKTLANGTFVGLKNIKTM